MRIDNYTKFLLTVICLCLVYLSLKDFWPKPKIYESEPIRVVLVDGVDHPVTNGGFPLVVELKRTN